MEFAALLILLALAQFTFFSIRVGASRSKFGVDAPSTRGNETWERLYRVQQNTMEQLVMFIPALWLYAELVNPLWGVGMGMIYLVGRFIYRVSYVKDPATRSAGFTISSLPIAVMLFWVLVDAGMKIAA